MDDRIYQVKIYLKGGAVVEADVLSPEITGQPGEGRAWFRWRNPARGNDRYELTFLDLAEVAAITLKEAPSRGPGF